MWHSCGAYSLEDLFARSEPGVFQLYLDLVRLVEAIGPVTVIPQKTRISIQAQVRFLGCYPRKNYLQVGFWFAREIPSPRFLKITKYAPKAYVHEIRVASKDEYDEEFTGWVYEAYQVGLRRHLLRPGEDASKS
jgi:hypothetical protein